ncbi:MAG: J domain-containing protein [Crocinitomicaceae bacterium]|nr:J domain-containing protein [Crocinitomicaceae bacterium]
MPKSKYYKILGLPNGASETAIRKRFRVLAMKYHPDKNQSPKAEGIFIELTEAYEILMNKRSLPNQRSSGGRSKSTKTTKEEHEDRVKEGKKRFTEQAKRERAENEQYFRYLTQGRRWKTIQISAVLGTLIAFLMVLDYFLPHHFKEDVVVEYNRTAAAGPSGQLIGLIKTKNDNYYWLSHMTYPLYSSARNIYVESSWIFHNPIRVISLGKTEYTPYDMHFTTYHATLLILPFFLVPLFTMRYKRMSVKFTLLYHLSYYGISVGIILFLLTGSRWAHLLTLGFV